MQQVGANQYRTFRLDDRGAIQAAFVFLRIDDALAEMAADTLALDQMVRMILLWSENAFADRSPLARVAREAGAERGADRTILRPEIGDLIRAAYDPVMPVSATDASHALRLAARVGATAPP